MTFIFGTRTTHIPILPRQLIKSCSRGLVPHGCGQKTVRRSVPISCTATTPTKVTAGGDWRGGCDAYSQNRTTEPLTWASEFVCCSLGWLRVCDCLVLGRWRRREYPSQAMMWVVVHRCLFTKYDVLPSSLSAMFCLHVINMHLAAICPIVAEGACYSSVSRE